MSPKNSLRSSAPLRVAANAVAFGACIFLVSAPAHAQNDRIRLWSGTETGEITKTTPLEVTIKRGSAEKTVPVSEIRSVAFGGEPSELTQARNDCADSALKTILARYVAKRLLSAFYDAVLLDIPMKQLSNKQLQEIADVLQQFSIKPNATEGYRTAEVTLGGVDCNEISSQTFEAKKCANLYFIGEVLDVSGWLGGYNFQWAWSSGWAAGQVV